ncbi:GNAT family N-acetyltransferase [Pantoea stewartii]|uniref:GNAT family N-acetyltransferase n=1 Tax=Pantoea stewartii TaxID=66269 RepID=UPI0021D4F5C7|nr:GNAT family N-acetyltransferase [Pantoea stewartii]MCU7368527.1 GNAT family N-acetyltransferase [Pantoea stewartii]
MTPEIVTERLRLKPLSLEDADAMQIAFPRWEIVRYLIDSVPWPYPGGGARDYIANVALPAVAAGTGWYWTLRPKAAEQQLIGVICLMETPDNNRGFWLVPEWQGQGYMTEACLAVTDYWFTDLKKTLLRTPKAALNQRSVNISVNSGMRCIRTEKKQYVSGTHDSQLWEVTREEWQAFRASQTSAVHPLTKIRSR